MIRERISRFIPGSVFVGFGCFFLYMIVTRGMTLPEGESPFIPILIAFAFILAGLWTIQPHEFFIRDTRLNEKITAISTGLLITFAGMFLALMSLVDDPESFHAPRGVVTAAGLTFAFAGLWITLETTPGEYFLKDLLNEILRNLLVTFFALVAVGVVLYPEPGTSTLTLPFFSIRFPAELSGCVFLPGALLLTWITYRIWRGTFQLFRKKWATENPAHRRQLTLLVAGMVVIVIAVVWLFHVAANVDRVG